MWILLCYFLEIPYLGLRQTYCLSLIHWLSVSFKHQKKKKLRKTAFSSWFWLLELLCVFFGKLEKMGTEMNLITTIIGFGMSATFIVFVCTRIICGRLRRVESRPMFEIESRIDLEQVLITVLSSLCLTCKNCWFGFLTICFHLCIYSDSLSVVVSCTLRCISIHTYKCSTE